MVTALSYTDLVLRAGWSRPTASALSYTDLVLSAGCSPPTVSGHGFILY